MKRKIVYLENVQKWRLKESHRKNLELPYKESPKRGWQYKVSIRGVDIENVFKDGLLLAGNISNINQVASEINRREVKIVKKKKVKAKKRKGKLRWKEMCKEHPE
jgi:hypothetical protein